MRALFGLSEILPTIEILQKTTIFLHLATQKFQSIKDMRDPGGHVGQHLANFYLGAKAGLPPVFVNKALLEQTQVPLFTYCLWQLWGQ